MRRGPDNATDGKAPRDSGVVVDFDVARGFGFIRSPAFAEDVFVHVTSVTGGGPLRVGQRVRFTAGPGERGPRATRVDPGWVGLSPARASGLGLAGVLALATWAVHRLGGGWAGAWLVASNAVTIAAYAFDKRRAGRGDRRVPEAVLLGLALAGGSPGAALAMAVLGHKTRKVSFQAAFAGVVALQVAGLWLWYRPR